MKSVFVFISCFVVSIFYAQENKILKVEYAEITTYIPQIVNHDNGLLLISSNESYYKTIFNRFLSRKKMTADSDDLIIRLPENEKDYFSEILINKSKNTLTENLFDRYAIKKFLAVSEKIPKMDWKLLKGEKKISDFLCKKAETTFRGRTYTVYYTEEIPVSAGPWKFNGLPGLILSAEDKEGIYKWKVKSVKYPYKGTFDLSDVYNRIKKFKKMSYKEFDSKRIEIFKIKSKTTKARSGQKQAVFLIFSTKQWKEPINKWRNQTDF